MEPIFTDQTFHLSVLLTFYWVQFIITWVGSLLPEDPIEPFWHAFLLATHT